MKATFRQIMGWWRHAVAKRPETHALKISLGAWIPEPNGPEIKIEIEVRQIEREMLEIIRDLCARSGEVEFQCSIEEMGEMKCRDSMNA